MESKLDITNAIEVMLDLSIKYFIKVFDNDDDTIVMKNKCDDFLVFIKTIYRKDEKGHELCVLILSEDSSPKIVVIETIKDLYNMLKYLHDLDYCPTYDELLTIGKSDE